VVAVVTLHISCAYSLEPDSSDITRFFFFICCVNRLRFTLGRSLQCEVKIHSILRHPHVVRFHHFFEDDKAYYMLLELAHNKSFSELMKKRKRLTEPEVR